MSSTRSRSGGHEDREDVEAIVEVFAELAVLDLLDHVAVGCRDEAEIDFHRPLGADRIDLTFLQSAEQLHLGFERQLADLIEKERAAVGFLEFAGTFIDSARERPLFMAEQNAFDQIFWDRTAVDGDEGAADAIALALNSASNELFADAAFAFDQNRNVRCGGALAERDHALHGFAAKNEIAEGQGAVGGLFDTRDFVRQRLDFQRALDRNFEPLRGSRFDDEVDGAADASR